MQLYVKILSGRTRQNVNVSGRVFELLQQPKKDLDGTYIVVNGSQYDDCRSGRCRVYLDDISGFTPASLEEMNKQQTITRDTQKTDEEISAEIKETFEILKEMTSAVGGGIVKGLVVSGAAGIGKSYTVEETLRNELEILGRMRGTKQMWESVHGAMSASVLYEKLYQYRDLSNVLVFDDCDGILYDEDALNILKAALDSKTVRTIHWNTNSYHLEKKDIPNSFEYKGSIIFITNIDFTQVRSPRISNHLQAIVSRCHYMSLGINSVREKMIHIRSVVDSTDMLSHHGFDDSGKQEVMNYVASNATKLREVSLRSCLKVADLRKAMPDRWRKFADKNVLKAA